MPWFSARVVVISPPMRATSVRTSPNRSTNNVWNSARALTTAAPEASIFAPNVSIFRSCSCRPARSPSSSILLVSIASSFALIPAASSAAGTSIPSLVIAFDNAAISPRNVSICVVWIFAASATVAKDRSKPNRRPSSTLVPRTRSVSDRALRRVSMSSRAAFPDCSISVERAWNRCTTSGSAALRRLPNQLPTTAAIMTMMANPAKVSKVTSQTPAPGSKIVVRPTLYDSAMIGTRSAMRRL